MKRSSDPAIRGDPPPVDPAVLKGEAGHQHPLHLGTWGDMGRCAFSGSPLCKSLALSRSDQVAYNWKSKPQKMKALAA